MPALQPVRGTQDLLPDTMRRHRHVSDTARQLAALYGFAEVATPIFEFTEVFTRPIGEHTDIVSKEMYTFTDRGGEGVTLRPENTAGVVRAVLSNGLTQQTPLKFFYSGPMFRYERPQKGRFRQFHQIGAEILGVREVQADIELIALGWRILKALGIGDRVELQLNTLGDPQSRQLYRTVIVSYFSAHKHRLSEDSLRRLTTNPLRILDSKDEGDREVAADAPRLADVMTVEAKHFYEELKNGLEYLNIAFTENPHLVRGLDYYTHTVFEFVTADLGSQGTVLAGGRYDGLVELMGGPAIHGVGWAAGIERLAMMTAEPPLPPRPVALIALGNNAELLCLRDAERLRDAGLAVEFVYSGNLQRRLTKASRLRARFAVIVGDNEIHEDRATVRDMDSGAQSSVAFADLPGHLASLGGLHE